MNQGLLGLAFGAGLVAALNPCGFALLPAYLTLVVRTERAGGLTAVGRALAATVAMTLGFLAAFGTFGLLTVTIAATVERFLPYVTIVIGISSCRTGYLAAPRPRPDGADSGHAARRTRSCADRQNRVDVRLRGGIRHRVAVLHDRPVPGGHRSRLSRRPDSRRPHGLSRLRRRLRVARRCLWRSPSHWPARR